MSLTNRVVAAVLTSPAHPLLSGSTDLVRYTGRRSGTTYTTPTQYARLGDDVVIVVGRPETKTWWRNFHDERPVELRLRGAWVPMRARAVLGRDDPDQVGALVDAYLMRFPRASRLLRRQDVADLVAVRCRPA